jgi:uncharacterized RDD family membrane protein YckC
VRCTNCGEPLYPKDPAGPSSDQKAVYGANGPSPEKGSAAAVERIARLGDRMLAVIFDGILIVAVFALVGTWVASFWGGITAEGFSMTGYPALTAMGLTALFAFMYCWLLEGLAGVTLGKLIIGIKVRDQSGGPVNLTQSFLRNVLRLVDGIALYLVGFFIALFSKRRQRLGDHAAKTIVIEKDPPTTLRVIWVIIWAAAVGGAIGGAFLIHGGSSPSSKAVTGGESVQKTVSVPSPSGATTQGGRLQVTGFQFLEGENGPVRAAASIRPQEKVFIEYRIVGAATDEEEEIHLNGKLTITDPDRQRVRQTDFSFKQKIQSGEPVRGWAHFTLPGYAPPGTYHLHVRIEDLHQKTVAEYTHPFVVETFPPVIPSGLEMRELKISLTEGGPPLVPPVVPAGNKVYTSAKLAGMQFHGDGIQLKISYKLIGPRGETILNKPDFLEIKDSWEYHPAGFFFPISFQVTPPSRMKGIFNQQFEVKDLIGRSSKVFSTKFEVK